MMLSAASNIVRPCSHQQTKLSLPASQSRSVSPRGLKLRVKAGKSGPRETSDQSKNDSYAKIEAPVRDTIPDQGPPVSERGLLTGEGRGDTPASKLTSDEMNPDKQILGTEVGLADSFRFVGALPEVANCRLAMLGFALAVFGELTTGRNVFEQTAHAPWRVAGVFLLFIVATAVPIVRGVPRRGNSIFSSDAEIINGRLAMLAFTILCIESFYHGTYTGYNWSILSRFFS